MAAIVGLSALKEHCQVVLHADSKYVCDAIELGWARKWRECGWYRHKTKRSAQYKALNSEFMAAVTGFV